MTIFTKYTTQRPTIPHMDTRCLAIQHQNPNSHKDASIKHKKYALQHCLEFASWKKYKLIQDKKNIHIVQYITSVIMFYHECTYHETRNDQKKKNIHIKKQHDSHRGDPYHLSLVKKLQISPYPPTISTQRIPISNQTPSQ